MTTSHLFAALFIAFGFVGWPIIGKYSQANGAWVGTVVLLLTGVCVAIISGQKLAGSVPTGKAFALLAVAGIVNGFACYVYAVKTADPATPSGVFVVLVVVLMAVLAPLMDWILNGSILSLRQMCGIGFVGVAIYLLR